MNNVETYQCYICYKQTLMRLDKQIIINKYEHQKFRT